MNRTVRRVLAAASTVAAVAALTTAGVSAPALAVTGAGFTTVNETVDGTGNCANGNPLVNCNIYAGKQYVWLNGGPSTAYVGDGTYFFAVLAPGGQPNPNDGGAKNLSDDFDTYANRTFTVSGATTTYSGTHDQGIDNGTNKIRLLNYADTPNHGGVYIMAICSLGSSGTSYPVTPKDCKYDAFKVRTGSECTENCGNTNSDLGVSIDASTSYTKTFPWTVQKSQVGDPSVSSGAGGASATFSFSVTATKGDPVYTNTALYGAIYVSNTNAFDVTGVSAVVSLVAGSTGLLGTCTYTPSGNQTAQSGVLLEIDYVCAITGVGSPPSATGSVIATISWDSGLGTPTTSAASDPATYDFGATATGDITVVNDSVDVYDQCSNAANATKLGTTSVTHEYTGVTCTVPVPAATCVQYSNTASVYAAGANTATTDPLDTDTVYFTVCGDTGGFTMGFWQNKNGQALINNSANRAGLCHYLFGYGSGTLTGSYNNVWAGGPAVPPSGTCANNNVLATWVTAVIKAANASMTGAPMYRGQFLATALSYYFMTPTQRAQKVVISDTVKTALSLLSNCVSIGDLLAAGNSQYSSLLTGDKNTFMAVKDVFDRINNGVALTC